MHSPDSPRNAGNGQPPGLAGDTAASGQDNGPAGAPPEEAQALTSQGDEPAATTSLPATDGGDVQSTRLAVLGRPVARLGQRFGALGQAWRQRWPAGRPRAEPGGAADAASTMLGRLTVLPAILLVSWLLPAVPLLLAGSFLPVPMLLISIPLAVALTVNGLRVVPVSWPRLRAQGSTSQRTWAAWFGLLATVAVVASLTAWQLREGSEALIVTRDPGTFLQTGYWLAQHGSLPIPQSLRAFGGPHPGLAFGSAGFIDTGRSVVPAVLPGLPLLLAAGFWIHGITGASAVGPVLGGLAVLAFAGLVGRLVGSHWAPAGALVLGLSLPQQYVGRTSLSETVLEILLFGGLSLLADSLALPGGPTPAIPSDGLVTTVRQNWRQLGSRGEWAAWLTPARVLAALAGLSLGLSLVTNLTALFYLLPVIPFAAILVGGRRPQATPFLLGIFVGCLYAVLSGYLLDRPVVDSVGSTLALAGVAAVWLFAPSIVALQLPKFVTVRRGVPRLLAGRPLRWLPDLGGVLVAAALVGFAVRPYVQTVRGHPSLAVYHFIRSLQRAQGLPADPTRLYSEQTLYWVIWYIGLPTVLLGGIGAALLVRRCLRALLTWRDPRGVWRQWGLPLAVICAGSAAVLWEPDIVPDQPWASRRLVVLVIPALVICGLWAASLLTRRARDRGARPATAMVAGVFCVAAMLVPTVSTTFGLGFSHGGKAGGLRPVAQGLATRRIGTGEVGAVAALCAQIPSNASVVIVSRPTMQIFTQVIRGMCGVPVASMTGQPQASVDAVIASIRAAGRRPVLLAARRGPLVAFGGAPVRVLDLSTTGDPHQLTQLPTGPVAVRYVIWMTSPVTPGTGA